MQIDFYLLQNDEADALGLAACQLLEKAYASKQQVFVFCDNQFEAEKIDELLWTFKKDSFIPHNLHGEGPEPPPPIQIGFGEKPRGFSNILLNLSAQIPPFYAQFKRIIEIVSTDEASKTLSRERYKTYRNQGHVIKTHDLLNHEDVSAKAAVADNPGA